MEKKLMNRTEAAVYLGFARETLLKWEKLGYGPEPKRLPSGLPIYSREALDSFVSEMGLQD